MPCSVSDEEFEAYHKLYIEDCKNAGRWDLVATKGDLAGWLCDSIRGAPPSDEALRWFQAHQKFHDKPLR